MQYHRPLAVLGLALLTAGCAGRVAHSGSNTGRVSALAAARDLTGTWQGPYWQVGMVYYTDDANCTVRVNEDQTFTAKCTRSPFGTNNLAKTSSWTGHVVTKGDRVVLDADRDLWPNIVLQRADNDTLYGVTLDPRVGATIELRLEREPPARA